MGMGWSVRAALAGTARSDRPKCARIAPWVARSARTYEARRARLLQEAARGVVGQDLAAGLAGGAVAHRVAGVLHLADGVAADRAGFPGALVHPAGAVGRSAHVGAPALEGQALVDRVVDGRDHLLGPAEPELGRRRERRELGPGGDPGGETGAEAG